ncbi:hypothetical protein PsorP6_014604 [Peronosclerospora sorghi]|uniref:Uncharacterized protein n=1 Tax=Peronosclerospora sorghi TaxID=230839 RepID=A0ACC0VUJ6_9STRA|nr:hypothetical protein PsorP6_014604 [Peronosclerospora sorghi]
MHPDHEETCADSRTKLFEFQSAEGRFGEMREAGQRTNKWYHLPTVRDPVKVVELLQIVVNLLGQISDNTICISPALVVIACLFTIIVEDFRLNLTRSFLNVLFSAIAKAIFAPEKNSMIYFQRFLGENPVVL